MPQGGAMARNCGPQAEIPSGLGALSRARSMRFALLLSLIGFS
jgi:hypothetical protein